MSDPRQTPTPVKRSWAQRLLVVLACLLIGCGAAILIVVWQVHREAVTGDQVAVKSGDSNAPSPGPVAADPTMPIAADPDGALPTLTATAGSQGVAPTAIGGPFQLTNQDGKRVSDADYRGKWLLVYFGYTYCPDMCPTGLQSIAGALDRLGPDAAKVQPLFITIDPARDTAAKLKDYVASFNPQIQGLTGTAAEIAAAAKAYKVYYAKAEKVDGDDYMMDHTNIIYVMDPEGRFVTSFADGVNPNTIAATLKKEWGGAKDNGKTP